MDAVFRVAFELDGTDPSTAAYGVTDGWDSVGHLQLVIALEEAFGISIDPDDVFEMRDYAAVGRFLERRHVTGAESP